MMQGSRLRQLVGWGAACLLLLPAAACALTWQIEVADPRRDAIYTSLALDSQDRPHISAYDVGNGALIYTRFDGTAWRTEVVDGGIPNQAGAYGALALDSQDRPHISYFYRSFDSPDYHYLRYAHFDGTAWGIETVDTQGGGHTSIALDAQGRPHISHCNCLNGILKYARFDGTAWRTETLDTGVIGYTSLKLDAHGRPHISYSAGRRLRHAHFDGTAWRLETVDEVVQPGLVEHTSLVLDREGRPHIAYASSGGMKYARWDGTRWRIEVALRPGGTHVSLGLDSGRRPVISFYDAFLNGGALRLARFDGVGWQIETVDSGVVGHSTSLKVDGQDRVHISYNAEALGALKYARGTPEVRLDLQLNQPSFRAGETLTLSATVTPGPAPLTADAYVALLLPDGTLLFLQGDWPDVEGPQPLVRDWPVTAVSAELFRYTFAGWEPPGTYTWLAVLTTPRTLDLLTPLVRLPFPFTP